MTFYSESLRHMGNERLVIEWFNNHEAMRMAQDRGYPVDHLELRVNDLRREMVRRGIVQE